MNNNKDADKEETNQQEEYNENQENEMNLKDREEVQQHTSKENKKIETHKKHNRFIASTLAIVMMILIFAIASVFSYEVVRESSFFPTKNHTKDYVESHDFVYGLARLTRYLHESKVQNNDWYDRRYENLESIKYYVSDKDNTFSISNLEDTTNKALQKEIKDSIFYLEIKFDENGNGEVESSLGKRFYKEAFLNNLTYSNKEDYAGLDIVYIVPKDFDNYNDFFTDNMKSSYVLNNYLILILIIGAISILILTIVAFSLPYSSQRKAAICKLYNRMFLELKILPWMGFVSIFFVTVFTGYGYNDFNIETTIYDANTFFYLIGIPVTFVLYLLIYLTIVYIKYIYYTGFKEGFLRNSIVGRICLNVFRDSKKILKEIAKIDIREDHHKKLFMILGVNLLALWIIALSTPLGFILAIAYSVFLFKYLLKLIGKVKSLNEATSQLAEGNFAITLDENIGILSPIAQNLNNIKEGFQLAVDKEIKSQKMKTELISNVSHDLKTPLTSIITYVDLLKNQDITAETQKEYIDILDKKSKRLKVLIEDLFEASKANSGNVELYLEKLDVIALFRQTLGELQEKINHSTLQMKINAPENKIICELDGKRTYRVFENIMSNILKYALPSSRVYIDIIENEQEVSFTFKNISAYEMNFDAAEITERFTRGDKSRNTDGSGLGLAIAKSFIELQNGGLKIIIDGDLFKLIVTFPKVE